MISVQLGRKVRSTDGIASLSSLRLDVDDSFSVSRRSFFDLFTTDSAAAAEGAVGVTNTLDAMASFGPFN